MITGIPTKQAILRIGNTEFTDLENLIVLFGQTGNVSKFTTLRRDNDAAGYQVTAGKTLYLLAARQIIQTTTGSQAHAAMLGYGDTDVGTGAAAAPTNAKTFAIFAFSGKQTTNQDYSEHNFCLKVPASKYPYFATDAGATWGGYLNLMVLGYER